MTALQDFFALSKLCEQSERKTAKHFGIPFDDTRCVVWMRGYALGTNDPVTGRLLVAQELPYYAAVHKCEELISKIEYPRVRTSYTEFQIRDLDTDELWAVITDEEEE